MIAMSEMTADQVIREIEKIKRVGPRRVLIREGIADSAGNALRDYGYVPAMVFLRDDGWSLGAPEHLIESARSLWPNDWVAVFRINV